MRQPTKTTVEDKQELLLYLRDLAKGGSSASTFLGLSDTPDSFSGQAGKVPAVNAGQTALEFVSVSGTGDMAKAVYDPSGKNANAFNVDNHISGTTNKVYTATEQTKLSGIAAGAEVNVNADWNAISGDAQILNKPTIPAAQVNSDWNSVSGLSQILNKPTLGTAAATASTDYAPAAKGVTNGDTHDHVGGDGAQIDHGSLAGLGDDDHTQYHTDARADTWIAAKEASYAPVSPLTVTYGTLTAGSYSDLAALGGTDVNITESASVNALQIEINFSSITQTLNQILFFGNYNGGSTHNVAVEIYDYVATAYEQVGLMATSTAKQWYSFPLFNGGRYTSAGASKIRFRHLQTGVGTHHLYLDYVTLRKSFGVAAGVTEHGALTGLDHLDHPASAIINTPSGNIAAVDVQSAINELDNEKVQANTAITGATKTKITYDAKGLVTAGADATAADVGAEPSGTVATHSALSTGVHGSGANSLIYSNDARLTDARVPTVHDSSKHSVTYAVPGDITAHAALSTGVHGSGANSLIYSNDSRLTDARTPTAHSQAESTITFTDITTGNASTSAHGYAPKGTAGTTQFWRQDWTLATPPSGSGSFSITEVELDFGATPIKEKVFTISDGNITATSKVIAKLSLATPTGRAADEPEMEEIECYCGQCSVGSFKLKAASDTGRVAGKYKFNYTYAG